MIYMYKHINVRSFLSFGYVACVHFSINRPQMYIYIYMWIERRDTEISLFVTTYEKDSSRLTGTPTDFDGRDMPRFCSQTFACGCHTYTNKHIDTHIHRLRSHSLSFLLARSLIDYFFLFRLEPPQTSGHRHMPHIKIQKHTNNDGNANNNKCSSKWRIDENKKSVGKCFSRSEWGMRYHMRHYSRTDRWYIGMEMPHRQNSFGALQSPFDAFTQENVRIF